MGVTRSNLPHAGKDMLLSNLLFVECWRVPVGVYINTAG